MMSPVEGLGGTGEGDGLGVPCISENLNGNRLFLAGPGVDVDVPNCEDGPRLGDWSLEGGSNVVKAMGTGSIGSVITARSTRRVSRPGSDWPESGAQIRDIDS